MKRPLRHRTFALQATLLFFGAYLALSGSAVLTAQDVRAAETTTTSGSAAADDEIVLQIPIPGFPHNNCKTFFDENNIPRTCVSSLGEYVKYIYQWFSGAVGILAAVMVLWGGFRWLTASGNTSRVDAAKETIYSAIIALVITLGSYVLLYTINPQLVNLQLYGVDKIGRIEQPSALCSENNPNSLDFAAAKAALGCDPISDPNCGCGKSIQVKDDPDKLTCTWNLCPGRDEVCRELEDNNYECVKVEDYCLLRSNGVGKDFCVAFDALMQSAKKIVQNAGTYAFEKKFTRTGCLFADPVTVGGASPNNCQWNYLFSDIETRPSHFPSNTEPKFVGCFEAGAKGECWDLDDNNKAYALDCSCGNPDDDKNAGHCKDKNNRPAQTLYRQVCVSPDQRAIGGVSGGCLKKTDGTYLCWAPPLESIDTKSSF